MDADILFSLLRGSLATPSTSLRSVVKQCCLHKKMKKTAGTAGHCTHSQMTSTVARSGHDPFLFNRKGSWRLLIYMSTPCHCARKVVHFPLIHANGHYYFASPYRKEINLIQVKNRAWSPSLPFFPSLLCHVFYIVLKKKKKQLQEVKKTFRKQTLPKVDVLVPKHY